MTQQIMRFGMRGVALIVVLGLGSSPALATNYWKNSVVNGSWSTGANWSAVSAAGGDSDGAPIAGEAVNIAFIDGTTRSVTYDVAAPTIGILAIDLIGPGVTTATLLLPGNLDLPTGGIAVGGYNGAALTNGRGTLTQSGGTTSTGLLDLLVGWGAGSTGVYTLSGGALVNNLNEYVGFSGTGTFNHSGGSNTINASGVGFFSVGNNASSTGTYNLSGTGTLSTATDQYIGNSGTGTFNQTGGTNTISGAGHSLYIGRNASGGGTYTISGTAALFSAGDIIVGNNGSGTLTIQDQASVYVKNNLSIKSFSSVNLNGGTLRFNTVGGGAGLNQLFYSAGTIQLAGTRVFGTDSVIPVLFPGYTIPTGKGLTIEGDANIQTAVAVNGGALTTMFPILRVGYADDGSLAVTNGGTVTANSNMFIGGTTDNYDGSVTINGVGSSLNSTSSTFIGNIGQGTLQITGGGSLTNEANATLGSLGINGSGTAIVNGAGSTWSIAGDLNLTGGSSGRGVLNIQNQGLVHVGGTLTINALNSINLNGGTLRLNAVSGSSLSLLNYTYGMIQLAGNRDIGADSIIQAIFGPDQTIASGRQLTIEGNATISTALTLNGGTLRANNLIVNGTLYFGGGLLELNGGTITGLTNLSVPTGGEFRAGGIQALQVTGAAGSTITATGNLTLGNAAAVNGFGTQGTLQVGANSVTLLDANDVVFDSLALATLGNAGSPGTLIAANGLTLDFGGNVTGFGTVSTPNNVAKPLINNGHISGNSIAQRITLPGYVKGVGTFDNVTFTGTFSPGLSSTVLIVGNVVFSPASTLVMELGGTVPGSGHDQLQSSDALAFDGTLLVSLINGFSPAAGQSFNLFDWITTSGTFDTLQLPTLAGLAWNTSQFYTTGVVSLVAAGLPGDYNQNGTVDAADYTVWRDHFGQTFTLTNENAAAATPGVVDAEDYAFWKSHFGATAGSGSGAIANFSVPEPATLVLLMFVATGWCVRRGRAERTVPSTH